MNNPSKQAEILNAAKAWQDGNPIKPTEPPKNAGFRRAADMRKDLAIAKKVMEMCQGPFSAQRCIDYWQGPDWAPARQMLSPAEVGLGESVQYWRVARFVDSYSKFLALS